MPERRPKRPVDVNQLGVTIGKIATGEVPDATEDTRDPAAVELGRKGGKARAARQTAEERQAQARKAVEKRWAQRSDDS